ncbi:MAG: hypothetical protein K2M78_14915 [Lachnospiraceae bacterium]|nr:hypothetical protein [Lachnospiraceae bacterium]
MRKHIVIFCMMILSLLYCACSSENKEEEELKNNLKMQNDTQEIMLEELTDFNWEKVYFISPYMSKEKIEEAIGFESKDIVDNISDESVLYVLFTSENQVICQIYGKAETLGFDFELGTYDDYIKLDKADSKFCINTIDGEKVYTLIKEQ